MPEHQLIICQDLQRDLVMLGYDLNVDEVHRFWCTYSERMASGFEGYNTGDFDMIRFALTVCADEAPRLSK